MTTVNGRCLNDEDCNDGLAAKRLSVDKFATDGAEGSRAAKRLLEHRIKC